MAQAIMHTLPYVRMNDRRIQFPVLNDAQEAADQTKWAKCWTDEELKSEKQCNGKKIFGKKEEKQKKITFHFSSQAYEKMK